MASYINTNIASTNTQNNLSKSQGALNNSIQRLSSGLRINSAKDDAAGMAISSRMESNIRGQTVAIRNANDAISFSQTAEGALGKISDSLQRMRELAVQSSNGSNSDDDRTALNTEFAQLQKEIVRIQDNTKFNDKAVIGSGAAAVSFQVGAGTSSDNQIEIAQINPTGLGAATTTSSGIDITTVANAKTAVEKIDTALKDVNTAMINQGAYQNRFAAVVSNLQTSNENQINARSRITDTDYAAETATLSRNQIMQQAGMAMLAQANQLPNSVMSLMR